MALTLRGHDITGQPLFPGNVKEDQQLVVFRLQILCLKSQKLNKTAMKF